MAVKKKVDMEKNLYYRVNKNMKPTFIIAGCGKCGTTTLLHLLARHPDVSVSKPKEPNFLSDDSVYAKGWEWYESLFQNGKDKIVRGEASVAYSLEQFEERVVERISAHIPDIKIIYIARNPFKRLESVYREIHNCGYQYGWYLPYTLKEAVEYCPRLLINQLYWQRTASFRSILPGDRILYLCLEDLQKNQNIILKQCLEFIGIEPSPLQDLPVTKLNEGDRKRYDTKLMRFIHTHPRLNRFYQQLPKKVREVTIPWLRKPFGKQPLEWDKDFRQDFIEQMTDDVQKYLAACGKPADFWGNEFVLGDLTARSPSYLAQERSI
jgi:hypothetical protein